ncbi:MAG TPA: OsmC family protein [Gaiellaceae bacterium]|nr:OsmC family protein [Gaiellaceae bacterium]
MNSTEVRRYEIDASSTGTFGRVLWSCRDQHFVADGPVQNGCPGEAVTPAELFLAGIATCGVELVQVIAKADGVPVRAVQAEVEGVLDPANPVRQDVRVFNSVRLRFELAGIDEPRARELVEGFKRR